MRLGTRIFLSSLIIFVICFYYPIDRIMKDLRVRYLESAEEPLVDQANILAAIVATEMENEGFSAEKYSHVFGKVSTANLSAQIYDLLKTHVDMRVYITDSQGRLVFDSEDRDPVGADYSRWRDVHLTLSGEYGARVTREDSEDPTSAVLYVAAPIVVKERVVGALTVAKPTTNVNAFLETARPRILKIGMVSAGSAVLLIFLVSILITRPIKRLTQYAHDVREGKKVVLPALVGHELKEMGLAFEKMREALEGKKYAEQYVQTLTHEIKSPLSAIRGAAELLQEGMPREKQARFLTNIRTEANRIQDIVDRLLELSSLENRSILEKVEPVSLVALARTSVESHEPAITQKGLSVVVKVDENLFAKGDPFLLHQALSNLLQNAIDFSTARGSIRIAATTGSDRVSIIVEDEGPGIPDFAKERVFERFFSLQRPGTGKKSTGLGLNFVKEVALLHGGEIRLENLPEGGLRAILSLPARQ
jgi:two-component system sensor histidine kinase CreC